MGRIFLCRPCLDRNLTIPTSPSVLVEANGGDPVGKCEVCWGSAPVHRAATSFGPSFFKPYDCTCNYPLVKLRNMSCHAPECPAHHRFMARMEKKTMPEQQQQAEIGDGSVVHLKSGGPSMTVEGQVFDGKDSVKMARCCWFTPDGELRGGNFRLTMLKAAAV